MSVFVLISVVITYGKLWDNYLKLALLLITHRIIGTENAYYIQDLNSIYYIL